MLLALALACRPAPAPPTTPPTVLLVSWDTTRADALAPYAEQLPWHPERSDVPQPRTPVAQGLADGGLRFAWALAHAPTTLSSHTTMMSGLDPHGHTVVRNGFPVPGDLPLLAERFRDAGWDTLAVVGGSPLERAMGLDRGFRVYDDAVGTHVRVRYEDPADRVTERALAAVDARQGGQPLFLFVHYFDAHSPWDSAPDLVQAGFVDDLSQAVEDPGPLVRKVRRGTLSQAESSRARGLYLAEVAWVDQQTGVLLDGLGQRGLLDDALVVLIGDHGEALDEPGTTPYGHGLDVDLVATHVPWIIHGSELPAGTVVEQPVGLKDLAPTVLSLAGLQPTLGDGRDLSQDWTAAALPVFSEATKPPQHEEPERWNNLRYERSVVHRGHQLIHTPYRGGTPQLYRLAAGQPAVERQEQRVATLQALLEQWDAAAPAHRTEDLAPATKRALQALGYVDE